MTLDQILHGEGSKKKSMTPNDESSSEEEMVIDKKSLTKAATLKTLNAQR